MKNFNESYPQTMLWGGIASCGLLVVGLLGAFVGAEWAQRVLTFGLGLLLFLPILGLLNLAAGFWALHQRVLALMAIGLVGLLVIGTWILHVTK